MRSEKKLNRNTIFGSLVIAALIAAGCGTSGPNKNGGMPEPAANSGSSAAPAKAGDPAPAPDATAKPPTAAPPSTDPSTNKEATPSKDVSAKPQQEGQDEATSKNVADVVQKDAVMQPGNKRERAVEGPPAVRVEPSGNHTKYVGKYEWHDPKFDMINADIKKRGKGAPIVSYLEVRADGTYTWSFGPADKMNIIEGTCESTDAKIVLHPYLDAKTKKPVTYPNEKKVWNLEFSKDGKSLDTMYKLGTGSKLMKYFKQN